VSGASAETVIHDAKMQNQAGGLPIPAHSKVVLSVGHGHVMLEKLFGTVRPGQTVNLDLTFQRAGVISVAAKVIAFGAPVPTGG
jgi:periplasmic copper chaperone A